jgi:aldehyde dehydrogenase (NAD+)
MRDFALVIDGRPTDGGGVRIDDFNPATEDLLSSIGSADASQIDSAVAAARTAFQDGSWVDPSVRSAALHRMADLLEEESEQLVDLIVDEVGTPISTARAMQVAVPISVLRFFADAALRDFTEDLGAMGGPAPGHSYVVRQPVGVVAAVTAYNGPLLMAAAKIGAALAAGCTAVLLPSPMAPLTSLYFGDVALRAAVPAGVLNVVAGGAEVGRLLTGHRGIDKISFTGSVGVGKQIMRQAADNVAGVVLELGGKSPGLILPDADLATAAQIVHLRYMRNAGQGCQCPTRILVSRKQYDEFVDVSRKVYDTVAVGDPRDPKVVVGPVISAAHRDRVEGYVAGALADGGEILAGGGRPVQPRGWYVNPTLIAGVTNASKIACEEIFGPVAVVLPYKDLDDAIAIANDSTFGLAAHLFGPTDKCRAVAPQLRAATITINGGGGFRTDAPISSFKCSGAGSELGRWGMDEFLVPQHIAVAGTP